MLNRSCTNQDLSILTFNTSTSPTIDQLLRAIHPVPPAHQLSREPSVQAAIETIYTATYTGLTNSLDKIYGTEHCQELLDTILQRINALSNGNRNFTFLEADKVYSAYQKLQGKHLSYNDIESELNIDKILMSICTAMRAAGSAVRVAANDKNNRATDIGSKDSPFLKDTLQETIHDLSQTNPSALAILNTFKGTIVYQITNHPTEFGSNKFRITEYELFQTLRAEAQVTPQKKSNLHRIEELITNLATNEPIRPTMNINEEVEFLNELLGVMWDLVPQTYECFYHSIRNGVQTCDGKKFLGFPDMDDVPLSQLSPLFQIGSWIAKDADGNPNVTAEAIRNSSKIIASRLAQRYLQNVTQLTSRLEPQWVARFNKDIGKKLLEFTDPDGAPMPATRRVNEIIESAQRFEEDLQNSGNYDSGIRNAMRTFYCRLITIGLGNNGQGRISSRSINDPFNDIARDKLDSNQPIEKQLKLLDEWLGLEPTDLKKILNWPTTQSEIDILFNKYNTLGKIEALVELGCPIIISNSSPDSSDVLKLAILIKLITDQTTPVSLIPLSESMQPIKNIPDIFKQLATLKNYSNNCKVNKTPIIVMSGPSDGAKEVGPLGAHYLQLQAMHEVHQIAAGQPNQDQYGIQIGLGGGHPRGHLVTVIGTPDYLHLESTTLGYYIRTIQGGQAWQELPSLPRKITYRQAAFAGDPQNRVGSFPDAEQAKRLVELSDLTGGTFDLIECFTKHHTNCLKDTRLKILIDYSILPGITKLSPLLSSRPTKRPNNDQSTAITDPLEGLRAIPVSQLSQHTGTLLVSLAGAGGALAEADQTIGTPALIELYQNNRFFQLHIDTLATVLSQRNSELAKWQLNKAMNNENRDRVLSALGYLQELDEDALMLEAGIRVISDRSYNFKNTNQVSLPAMKTIMDTERTTPFITAALLLDQAKMYPTDKVWAKHYDTLSGLLNFINTRVSGALRACQDSTDPLWPIEKAAIPLLTYYELYKTTA
jgi:phosphoenolpyruvate carboxylase